MHLSMTVVVRFSFSRYFCFLFRVTQREVWKNISCCSTGYPAASAQLWRSIAPAGKCCKNYLCSTVFSCFHRSEKFLFFSTRGTKMLNNSNFAADFCLRCPFPALLGPCRGAWLNSKTCSLDSRRWKSDCFLSTKMLCPHFFFFSNVGSSVREVPKPSNTISMASTLHSIEPAFDKNGDDAVWRDRVGMKSKCKRKPFSVQKGEKGGHCDKYKGKNPILCKTGVIATPQELAGGPGSRSEGGDSEHSISKESNAFNHKQLRIVGMVQAKLPHPYQSFSDVTSAADFHKLYSFLKPEERFLTVELRVGGRLCSIRHMGAILFLSIRSNGDTLQVICQVTLSPKTGCNEVADNDETESGFSRERLKSLKDALRVGDIIGAIGSPGRTKKGELSLYATKLEVVAPYVCADQATCPDLKGFTPLVNQDLRYRYRFMDMMINKETRNFFLTRHRVLRALRAFLDHQGFVEVETPILLEVPSGASAKPFTTYHEGNATTLSLRIAPELYLKQFIVGGIEKVYEIGRVFRNEDADRTHNPEFTTCELYSAFSTYQDLLLLTEDLFRRLAIAANGKTTVTLRSVVSGGRESVTIDLAKPFRRVSVYEAIEKAAGVKLPPANELQSPRGVAYLSAILLRYDIPLPPVRTTSKMFDKLIDYFIVSKEVEPIFVMDHPVCMSPLAKAHTSEDKVGLAERFELFINGVEYCNSYSELNDPEEQFCRFQQQLLDRHSGDKEAMQVDETFLKALQVGMPPTAGWGLGIDRLIALLSETDSIRDVIFSPLLRTDYSSHDGKRRRKTAGFFSFSPVAVSFVLRSVEEEMRRRGLSSSACDRVRELHSVLTKMHKHQLNGLCNEEIWKNNAEKQELIFSRSLGTIESRRWLQEMSRMMIRIICGPGTR